MIYQLAVTLPDTEYKCESCVLSPGQDVSNKFIEIDRAISTQKTLGNGGNLNDNTINNPVDLLTPANNANIESGGTGPPLETDVDQQASVPNADPQRAAQIQKQGVPQLQQRDQRDVQQQPADLGILDLQRPGHHDARDTAQILDKQQRHQQQHIGHGLLDQQQRVLTQRHVQQQPADPGSLDRQHAGHHNNRDTTHSL